MARFTKFILERGVRLDNGMTRYLGAKEKDS